MLIVIINLLITGINVVLLGLNFKLYTEYFKDKSITASKTKVSS